MHDSFSASSVFRAVVFVGFLLVGVNGPATGADEPILYGWTGDPGGNYLATINLETGEKTEVFRADRSFECLAYDSSTETLYAIENVAGDNVLAVIDPPSRTITDVGLTVGYREITACTYDESTNTLLALEQNQRVLLSVDTGSGAATAIGTITSYFVNNSMATEFGSGDLYASASLDPAYLVQLEKSSDPAVPSIIGSFGADVIVMSGMAFHPFSGVLYGTGQIRVGPSSPRLLMTIDVTTGLATPVGNPHDQVGGLAFVFSRTPPLQCEGFESPMDRGPVTVRGRNRALPLKGQLFDGDGYPVTDLDLIAPPIIQVLFSAASSGAAIDVTGEVLPVSLATEGNQFFYDEDGYWHLNFKTKDYTAPGTYLLYMDTGDDTEYIIDPTCYAEFRRD